MKIVDTFSIEVIIDETWSNPGERFHRRQIVLARKGGGIVGELFFGRARLRSGVLPHGRYRVTFERLERDDAQPGEEAPPA